MGKMDLAQTACVEETAGVVEGEMEERKEEKSTGVEASTLPFSLLTRISVTRVILSAFCTLNQKGWLLWDFE